MRCVNARFRAKQEPRVLRQLQPSDSCFTYKSTSFRSNLCVSFAKLTRAFSRLKLKNAAQIAHFLRTCSRRNSAPPALPTSSVTPLESLFCELSNGAKLDIARARGANF